MPVPQIYPRQFLFRLDEPLYRIFKATAKADGFTMSEIIRDLIALYVEACRECPELTTSA